MTENEIVFLLSGITIGVCLMALVQLLQAGASDRRDRRILDRERARLRRDRATDDWRDTLGGAA